MSAAISGDILGLGNDTDFPIISSHTQTFLLDLHAEPSRKKKEEEAACSRNRSAPALNPAALGLISRAPEVQYSASAPHCSSR